MAKARRKKKKGYKARSSKSDALAREAFEAEPDKIIFEEEATQEAIEFQDHAFCLYGPPKIGKTTLAHYVPGAYFLPTEIGYKFKKLRKTRIPNWATFTAFVKYAEKKPKFCKTVKLWVIDTSDNLSKFCMQYTCGREGIAHPTDLEWGKGWDAFRDEFNHWILRLGVLGPGMMFISHETEKDVIYRGMKVPKAGPAMPKTTYAIINNMADVIISMGYTADFEREERVQQRRKGKKKKKGKGEMGRIKETRCLYLRGSSTREAGDRTGMLPEIIPFDNERQAVKKLLSYFK